MFSPRAGRLLQRYWPDVLVTAATWGAALYCCALLGLGLRRSAVITPITLALQFALFFPGALALWLQVRLVPLVLRLKEPVRREQIAITPLPPGEYLRKAAARPLLMALAPATAWLLLMLCTGAAMQASASRHILRVGPVAVQGATWQYLLFLLGFFATIVSLTLCGGLYMLHHLCRGHSLRSAFTPVVFTLAAVALTYVSAFLAVKWLDGTRWHPLTQMLSYTLVLLALIWLYGWWRWRRATQAYCRFE